MNSTTFHGPLRYNPTNPRYFTDDTGQTIYLTGETFSGEPIIGGGLRQLTSPFGLESLLYLRAI